MKKIGFLSFGHWSPSAQSGTRSAADALLQSIDLAVAAEDLGRTAPIFAYTTLRASWDRRSAAGRHRRQNPTHRDRHWRDRHAL